MMYWHGACKLKLCGTCPFRPKIAHFAPISPKTCPFRQKVPISHFSSTPTDEKTVVNSHSNELPYKFAVNVKERKDKLSTMY